MRRFPKDLQLSHKTVHWGESQRRGNCCGIIVHLQICLSRFSTLTLLKKSTRALSWGGHVKALRG